MCGVHSNSLGGIWFQTSAIYFDLKLIIDIVRPYFFAPHCDLLVVKLWGNPERVPCFQGKLAPIVSQVSRSERKMLSLVQYLLQFLLALPSSSQAQLMPRTKIKYFDVHSKKQLETKKDNQIFYLISAERFL